MGPVVEVDTSGPVDPDEVARAVLATFGRTG
jgi:hypothetical protein